MHRNALVGSRFLIDVSRVSSLYIRHIIKNILKIIIDILKERVYGWTRYPTLCGVGDAYPRAPETRSSGGEAP
jgi:hypothetical protein